MNRDGVIVLLVVLVIATAFAVWRRATDGRWRAHQRRKRTSSRPGTRTGSSPSHNDDAAASEPAFPTSELGITLGERATLVQFSTAFCQPCRATRRVLGEVAELVDGVVAVEVDAEAHLDLVREWKVMRTPTVFVLDAAGAVVQRASGQPRKADVIAAVGALEPPRSGL